MTEMQLSSSQITSYGFGRFILIHSWFFLAKSPAVEMPLLCKNSEVLGPMPQIFSIGVFLRNSSAVFFKISVKPFGFCHLEATLAKTFEGPRPIDTDSPISSFTSFLIRWAIGLGPSKVLAKVASKWQK